MRTMTDREPGLTPQWAASSRVPAWRSGVLACTGTATLRARQPLAQAFATAASSTCRPTGLTITAFMPAASAAAWSAATALAVQPIAGTPPQASLRARTARANARRP